MSTNKTFLKNTIRGVVTENRHLSREKSSSSHDSRDQRAERDTFGRETSGHSRWRDAEDGRMSSRKRQSDSDNRYESRISRSRHERKADKDWNSRTMRKDYKHERRKEDGELSPKMKKSKSKRNDGHS